MRYGWVALAQAPYDNDMHPTKRVSILEELADTAIVIQHAL